MVEAYHRTATFAGMRRRWPLWLREGSPDLARSGVESPGCSTRARPSPRRTDWRASVVSAPTRSDAAGAVQTWGNYIAGEWRPAKSGATFENRNPANRDDLIGRFAASGPEDVADAVAAAAEAFESWRLTSPIVRANILHKAANILESRV